MGNFHCIPKSCARVVWREYLPPSIRYRYEGEDWQYVDGDDYELKETINLSLNTNYSFVYRSHDLINGNFYTGEIVWSEETISSGILVLNGIFSWRLKVFPFRSSTPVYPTGNRYTTWYWDTTYNRWRHQGFASFYVEVIDFDGQTHDLYLGAAPGLQGIKFINYESSQCKLTVLNNNEIVHEEVRDVCPEVEKLDCRLDDVSKQIKIEKTPYLERIEVVPYAYQNARSLLFDGDYGLGVRQAAIPDECLNIYNNLIATIIPRSKIGFTPTNTPQAGYGFIQQICSAPGCPPPEYEVICDCDCTNCPDGTCAKQCGDHICCYDTSTGKAVLSIPLDEYCGGENQ